MCENNVKLPKGSMLPLFVLAMFIYVAAGVNAGARASDREIAGKQSVTSSNRPMRNRRSLVLTVGQTEGDLQGNDDKVIQAGIEYLHRLGGGTLEVLPGVYNLRNAIYLRPNITLRGSGEKTVLRKAGSVVTALARDSDWFEYGVQVADIKGFVPGGGVMLRSKKGAGDWQYDVLRATVTAIEGDVIFLDRLTEENFWLEKDATTATIFPLLTAENVDNVAVEDIVLDGNRDENEHINGNFSGGVFIQHCNRWRFKNVTSRNYNGDGFSFQVCDDIRFLNCKAINNSDLGFHPSGPSSKDACPEAIVREFSSAGAFPMDLQRIVFCLRTADMESVSDIVTRTTLFGDAQSSVTARSGYSFVMRQMNFVAAAGTRSRIVLFVIMV